MKQACDHLQSFSFHGPAMESLHVVTGLVTSLVLFTGLLLAGQEPDNSSTTDTADSTGSTTGVPFEAVSEPPAVQNSSWKGHSGAVTWLAFSPDGTRLASASYGGTATVWDATNGREILTLTGHSKAVRGVAYTPDGKWLATASDDRTVKIWDAATGQEAHTFTGHAHEARTVTFSPDGKRLASASQAGGIRVWDIVSGQVTLILNGYSVSFSSDGTQLVTGGPENVMFLDASTGCNQLTLKGHKGRISSVAFSLNGNRVASASYDGTVKVWDAASGQEILTLRGHTNYVQSVAFSPDGTSLLTASYDRTVRLWDVATGQELMKVNGHINVVTCATFSPDGTRIASSSQDGTIKVRNAIAVSEQSR